MKKEIVKAFDGTELSCYLWDDVKDPKGIVQISHGMAEHALRYDDFAKFLNSKGYIVFADDHRAHGETSAKASKKNVDGYHQGNIFEDTVEDMIQISNMLTERYKLPLILFGHSYGSFLSQRYIQKKNPSKGVILSGTAHNGGMLTKLGQSIATSQYKKTKGGEAAATTLDKMSFGAFNKPFKNDGSKYAWLSRDKAQVKKYEDDPKSGQVMSIAFFKYMLDGLVNLYKKPQLDGIPKEYKVAMFSGANDPVGGKAKKVFKLEKLYKSLGMKNVFIKIYPECRHEILNETNNEEVYNDILTKIDEFNR